MTVAPSEPRDLTAEEAEECIAGICGAVEIGGEWIAKALNGRAWIALGYDSWDAMCDERLAGIRLTIPLRREAVTQLRSQGHSTRAIASGLGVSEGTVRTDLTGAQNYAPPAAVKGLDGKTYTPPTRPAAQPLQPGPLADRATGEIREPTPNPIAAAVKAARSGAAHVTGKELERVLLAVRGINQAGGPDAVMADLTDSELDRACAADLLTVLDQSLPTLTALRAQLVRRNMRSVK
jgi:hypothetical protein